MIKRKLLLVLILFKNQYNSREKLIISKRFFDGRTQMEIANEIGISQAQVSRLEKNAIERIKKLYS